MEFKISFAGLSNECRHSSQLGDELNYKRGVAIIQHHCVELCTIIGLCEIDCNNTNGLVSRYWTLRAAWNKKYTCYAFY
jgi:hypothetical protein